MSTWTQPVVHTARKEHRCSLCNRTIDPGEKYEKHRGYDAGEAWTFKLCTHCRALESLYGSDWMDLCDSQGYTGEDVSDWATEADHASPWHRAGFRMGWRRRYSRTLLPVPALAGDDA